jgi:hypothetical protein
MRPPRIPAQLRTDVFGGSDAVDAGLLSRRSLAGRSWRRLYPDVYVRLQTAGWRIVFFTTADLHRPAELVVRIAVALGCVAVVR